MPSSMLFAAALLLPIGFAMPVPQTLSTTITGPGGRPVGTATLGGLDTTLTLGQGPQNSLPYNGGGNQPPCRPWLSNCQGNNGNNWPNVGGNWPYRGNSNDDNNPYGPGSNAPWDSNYSPSPLPDAPGGPAGTATVSTYGSGFKSGWTKMFKRDDPASGWWNWFRGNGGSFGGLTSSISSPTGAVPPRPAAGASNGQGFGGLSSGITLGGGR